MKINSCFTQNAQFSTEDTEISETFEIFEENVVDNLLKSFSPILESTVREINPDYKHISPSVRALVTSQLGQIKRCYQ